MSSGLVAVIWHLGTKMLGAGLNLRKSLQRQKRSGDGGTGFGSEQQQEFSQPMSYFLVRS